MNPTLGAGKTFWSWTRLTSRAFGPGLPEDCDPGGATSPIEGSQRPHVSCFRAPGPSEAGQLGAGWVRPPTRLPAQPGPPRTAGSYPPPPTHTPIYEAELEESTPHPQSRGSVHSLGSGARGGVVRSNPVLGPQVCTWGDRGWTSHLYTDLLFNPVPEHREPRVHTRLVPLRAALTPAHHAGLKHPPIRLRAGQGAPGVTLRREQVLERRASTLVATPHPAPTMPALPPPHVPTCPCPTPTWQASTPPLR